MNIKTKLRSFGNKFLPIKKCEIPKILPMAIMFVGIIFIYTVCRQMKDILITETCGKDILPIAKVLVIGASVYLAIIHRRLSMKYSHYKAFLISLLPFVIFFFLFGIFFDKIHYIHLSSNTINILSKKYTFLKYPLLAFGNWVITLNYILSEMFGSLILTVTCWQFFNFYTTSEEAKRFYPFLLLVGQIGSGFAGQLVKLNGFIVKKYNLHSGIILIYGCILLVFLFVFLSLRYFCFKTLKNPNFFVEEKKEKKKKVVVPFLQAIKELRFTLILVCLLTFWYGLCATSIETFWKNKVFSYCCDNILDKNIRQANLMSFYGSYYTYTSLITFFFNLFISPLFKYLPWIFSAIATPIVVFSSVFIFGSDFISKFISINSLLLSVTVGAIVLILFKTAKYVLFDSSKEIFLRNQKEDEIILVKSLETFMGRFGKGGSSIIQSIILILIPTMTIIDMAPILCIITIIISSIWIFSVLKINKEMLEIEKKEKEK